MSHDDQSHGVPFSAARHRSDGAYPGLKTGPRKQVRAVGVPPHQANYSAPCVPHVATAEFAEAENYNHDLNVSMINVHCSAVAVALANSE